MITDYQNQENKIYITKPLVPKLEDFSILLEDILKNKSLTNFGKYHTQLEHQLKNYLEISNLSLVNNGTLGLLFALKVLEINSGEIITTPFTFPATPHAISWNNLTPVFCDIDEKTMCIDANKIEKLITENTKAILGVHVYGFPCEVEKIQKIADKYSLKVIYDAAHAFNTRINGIPIVNYGDVSVLSFHATKLFHTIEGGGVISSNIEIQNKINLIRNFGIKNEEEVIEVGINGKLNEIQSAMGTLILDLIDEEIKKRDLVRKNYICNLSNIEGIIIPEFPDNVTNSHQYFIIRIDEEKFGYSRDHVHQNLQNFGIMSRKYFYPLCSSYPHYKKTNKNNFVIAEKISNQILCLPLYGDLPNDITSKIASIIYDNKKNQNNN